MTFKTYKFEKNVEIKLKQFKLYRFKSEYVYIKETKLCKRSWNTHSWVNCMFCIEICEFNSYLRYLVCTLKSEPGCIFWICCQIWRWERRWGINFVIFELKGCIKLVSKNNYFKFFHFFFETVLIVCEFAFLHSTWRPGLDFQNPSSRSKV